MLKDKIIVITGGSGLLGLQFVRIVIENGGIPIIADINSSSLEKSEEMISREHGENCFDTVVLDITSLDSINNMITYLDVKYGKIDALINNAYPRNKGYGKHFFDVQYEDFVDNLGMNLGGYFLVSQICSKYFKSQGYGNIVNISSIYGVISPRFEIYDTTKMTTPVEYAVIKAGLIHLTKYMAKYLKGINIRVNSISPGGILNDQPEEFLRNYKNLCSSKGMLDNSDINGTLIYLLSDMSKFLNGQNIIVDDGFSL